MNETEMQSIHHPKNSEYKKSSKNKSQSTNKQIDILEHSEIFIRLKNEILRSIELSGEAKMTYISLRYLMSFHLLNYPLICSLNTLSELFLKEDLKNKQIIIEDKKLHKILLTGLIELEQKQLIKILKSSNNIFILDLSNIQFNYSLGGYTEIQVKKIKDILLIPEPEDVRQGFIYKIILYYIILTNTINSKTKIGFTPINTLREYTGFGQTTIDKINNILENREIIKIYRQWEVYNRSTGKIHIEGNKYYLPENEEEVLFNIKQREHILSEEEQLSKINREIKKRYKTKKATEEEKEIKKQNKKTDKEILEIDEDGNFIF